MSTFIRQYGRQATHKNSKLRKKHKHTCSHPGTHKHTK